MTNLSEHFSMREVEFSRAALRNGIDNSLPNEYLQNAIRMAEILEIIRKEIGRPIIISSWYRSPKVNKLDGGSKTSAHMEARAADIHAEGLTPAQLAIMIKDIRGLNLDQLILEYPPNGWVHCGISEIEDAPRGQVLTAKTVSGWTGNRTEYFVGLLS